MVFAVICDVDDRCSVNIEQDPESSCTISIRSTIRPLYFLVLCLQFGNILMTEVIDHVRKTLISVMSHVGIF